MKKLIFTIVVVFALSTVTAQQINWVTLEEAIELQKENPKKIIIDMYTNWCGPCKMLDKNTFHNKDVADYVNQNYYAVKFNAEGNDVVKYNGTTFTNPKYKPENANRRNSPHELASYFRLQAYPTIVFLSETGEFLAPIRGYKKPQQLEMYLKLFKNDDYKNLKTQEEFAAYAKAFKPEFSEN